MCDFYILGRFYKKEDTNFFVWWLKSSMVTKDLFGEAPWAMCGLFLPFSHGMFEVKFHTKIGITVNF
jgi:hypothetical protein